MDTLELIVVSADGAERPVSSLIRTTTAMEEGGTAVWIGADSHRFLRLRVELPDGTAFWKLHRRDMEAWRRSR